MLIYLPSEDRSSFDRPEWSINVPLIIVALALVAGFAAIVFAITVRLLHG